MFIAYIATIVLSIFSTSVMSYIAMATPIGPWIAPTLALISLLLMGCLPKRLVVHHHAIALAVSGGSIGGILATAVGFYFPTLYFLDAEQFNQLLAQPILFCGLISSVAFVASSFGFLIANVFEQQLLHTQKLPFVVGTLVHTLLATGNQIRKAWQLFTGFLVTLLICVVQKPLFGVGPLLPRSSVLLAKHTYHMFVIPRIILRFDQLPMLLAIGFIAGHVIALPLLVGLLAKLLVVEPINGFLFATISSIDFTMAFCSGLVLFGAFSSFTNLYSRWRKQSKTKLLADQPKRQWSQFTNDIGQQTVQVGIVLVLLIALLTMTGFSLVGQLFVITATAIAAYQIIVIAGKIGLATMGRFATFVMVPALILFGCNSLQATVIATLVGCTGGVGADLLFGRKLGQLAAIPTGTVRKFQFLGIVVSSLAIGVIVWLLVCQFGLGSPELFAQRAQARALLINCTNFNYYVLALGFVFGVLLKKLRVNGLLVLGGLLMPIDYSLALIAGGFIANNVIDQKLGEPFWSGVFAANSLWMLLQGLF